MALAGSTNAPVGLPSKSKRASRIADRRGGSCTCKYSPAGPIPNENGAHSSWIADERDDELRQRTVEGIVRKRESFGRGKTDVGTGYSGAACGNERLRQIDAGDMVGADARRQLGSEGSWATTDVEHRPRIDTRKIRETRCNLTRIASDEPIIALRRNLEAHGLDGAPTGMGVKARRLRERCTACGVTPPSGLSKSSVQVRCSSLIRSTVDEHRSRSDERDSED